MVETKMNIKELKADIQKYLDENLVVERACYDLAAEPMVFYQEALPMEADLLEDMEPTFSQTLFKMIKEKGISEIIIGKQRNGPIGTVKLAWLPEYTKFANLEH